MTSTGISYTIFNQSQFTAYQSTNILYNKTVLPVQQATKSIAKYYMTDQANMSTATTDHNWPGHYLLTVFTSSNLNWKILNIQKSHQTTFCTSTSSWI